MATRSSTFDPVFDPKRGKAGRRAPSGGSAVTWRAVATTEGARLGDLSGSFGTYNYASVRRNVQVNADQTKIKVAIPNFGFQGVFTAILANGGALTVSDCAIEYPAGVFTPVTWGGGNNSVTGPAITTIVNSLSQTVAGAADGVLISDPVTVSIPANTDFWVWFEMNNPNGIDHLLRGTNEGGSDALGDGVSIAKTASPGFATARTAFASWSKNIGAGAWVPLAQILGANHPKPAVFNHGTSISHGTDLDDTTTPLKTPRGIIGRGMPVGAAFFGAGQPGQLAQDAVVQAPWKGLYPYFDVFINEFYVNDVGHGRSNAQIIADQTALAADIVAHGAPASAQFWICTGLPSSSSTDGFTTTVNQTVNGAYVNTTAYNNSLRAGISGWPNILDLCDFASTAHESGKWAVTNPHARTVTTLTVAANGLDLTLSGSDTFFASDVGWTCNISGGGTTRTIANFTDATHADTTVRPGTWGNSAATNATAYIGGSSTDGIHGNTGSYTYIGSKFGPSLLLMGF